jgi:pyrroloquinoline quinone biosynthesis protein B
MRFILFFCLALLCACESSVNKAEDSLLFKEKVTKISLVVLGAAQDGGFPHIGCQKKCCKELFLNSTKSEKVVSLGLIDPLENKTFLLEATPDFPAQLRMLKNFTSFKTSDLPDGIFLTHAHIGHYTGLIYLGKEAMNADSVKVYAMPRMKTYLESNGPWSQLVNQKNIQLSPLVNGQEIKISSSLKITPFLVPHRDEFSETVGYKIEGPNKKALFIPDIDKWTKWDEEIVEEIKKVDYAFVDATFFDAEEIQNRDISQIPHPFVIESMELFKDLEKEEKNKIYFIHFNHTNPLLNKDSKEYKRVIEQGYHIAEQHLILTL